MYDVCCVKYIMLYALFYNDNHDYRDNLNDDNRKTIFLIPPIPSTAHAITFINTRYPVICVYACMCGHVHIGRRVHAGIDI